MKLSQESTSLIWGFTSFSETWNGRLAMLAFFMTLIIETLTGKGVLHFMGIE